MTIYDIAKEAGVSASTVSRVINNDARIRPATKQKVLEIVEKYNFRPSAAARGLVNQSTMIIGILVSDIRMVHHTEGAYIIENALAELGYCCILLNAGNSEVSQEECVKVLVSRRVDGIVMMGSAFQTEHMKRLIAQYLPNLPIVMANGYLELSNVYGVLADERSGIADCVKLLVSKEHTQPAFINNPSTASNQQKEKGFEIGINTYNLGKPIIFHTEGDDERVAAYKCTKQLLQSYADIDSIIYHTDLAASGGVRALLDVGIEIPNQIAVIGVDNSIYAEVCYPQITSLDNKLAELSNTCAYILIQVLQGKHPPHKMLIFSEIVQRETT